MEYIFTLSQTTVHSPLTKCRVDILDDLWAAGAALGTKGLVVSQMLSTPQGGRGHIGQRFYSHWLGFAARKREGGNTVNWKQQTFTSPY